MKIEYLNDHPVHVRTIAQWLYDEFYYVNPASVEQRMEMLRQSRRNQIPVTVVAVDGREVLGIASLIESDMKTRPDLTPWLARVYVAPAHRRKGVGSALVLRITQEAKRLEQSRIYLYTTDQEHFYARLGWSVLERTTYLGYAIVIMEIEPGA